MNKTQKILRKKQRKIKDKKRENNFDIDILRKEIRKETFRIHNGKDIDNIFKEDFRNQEVDFYER